MERISPNMVAIKNRAQMYLIENSPMNDPKKNLKVFLNELPNRDLCFYFSELVLENIDVPLTGMLKATQPREIMAHYLTSYLWPYIRLNKRVMARLKEAKKVEGS